MLVGVGRGGLGFAIDGVLERQRCSRRSRKVLKLVRKRLSSRLRRRRALSRRRPTDQDGHRISVHVFGTKHAPAATGEGQVQTPVPALDLMCQEFRIHMRMLRSEGSWPSSSYPGLPTQVGLDQSKAVWF